jgi:transglutaminase-like putative cysteine protease
LHFDGTHYTHFDYSHPVLLDPLTVRLCPRDDFRQRRLRFSLVIDPQPAQFWEALDWEGNRIACATFREPAEALTIRTSFAAETADVNPFEFLLLPEAARLPLAPTPAAGGYFALYAQARQPGGPAAALARRIAEEVDYQTVPLVVGLNEWIHREHEKIVRPVGDPWEPQQTLREARGACRDLAVLLIEGCRTLGLPSRFVSGYCATGDETEDQLHAWAEVYLPGAGWRGFDPSLGLAVTERHLAVATGAAPAFATPMSGTYRGEASSRLTAEIELIQSNEAATADPLI